MVTYRKQFYPELEQSDFDEHIVPLLHYIDDLSVHPAKNLNNVKSFKGQEFYPYHNPCRMIARNIWEKVSDTKMDKYLLDPESFKNAICELFSQIAFSYLIRCFAEQINTLPTQSMNSKDMYDYYNQELIDTQFKEFADTYPIVWGRLNNLLENRALAFKEIGPVSRYGDQGWTPGVLGYDLYSGRVGPALALAVAGKLLSDDSAIKAANDIFEKSAKILEERSFELRNVLLSGIGGFSGVSGLLWTLFAAGNIVGNERWKDIAVNSWPILHLLFPFMILGVFYFSWNT